MLLQSGVGEHMGGVVGAGGGGSHVRAFTIISAFTSLFESIILLKINACAVCVCKLRGGSGKADTDSDVRQSQLSSARRNVWVYDYILGLVLIRFRVTFGLADISRKKS